MMESEREQLLYGDRCKHGTNIGTPSGADFMCHYCEMGMDTWVADPMYALMFKVDPMVYPTKLTEWRESGMEVMWDRLVTEWTKPDCLWVSPDALDLNPTFVAELISDGYWSE